jgi:molecular chaperone HtpG
MKEGKKDEEVPQEEKDLMNELREKTSRVESEKRVILEQFGAGNPLTNQLVDLAFLANNMLKGEALANFVKRSIEMIR